MIIVVEAGDGSADSSRPVCFISAMLVSFVLQPDRIDAIIESRVLENQSSISCPIEKSLADPNNIRMYDNITFSCQDDYLLVSITDRVITFERAQEILSRIGEECTSLNCKKVLLDEMSVERREVPPSQIKQLAFDLKKNNLDKVYIAFLCQPHLVGYDSHLLSLYTYMTEFVIQHFTSKEEAVDWLDQK